MSESACICDRLSLLLSDAHTVSMSAVSAVVSALLSVDGVEVEPMHDSSEKKMIA